MRRRCLSAGPLSASAVVTWTEPVITEKQRQGAVLVHCMPDGTGVVQVSVCMKLMFTLPDVPLVPVTLIVSV